MAYKLLNKKWELRDKKYLSLSTEWKMEVVDKNNSLISSTNISKKHHFGEVKSLKVIHRRGEWINFSNTIHTPDGIFYDTNKKYIGYIAFSGVLENGRSIRFSLNIEQP